MGVKGVALGTLLAEFIAAAAGLAIAARHLSTIAGQWRVARLVGGKRLSRTVAVNRDIMIRSLALIVVVTWFTAQGAQQGESILAANAVLMQFIAVSAFFLDGLAFAAEALVGQAVGARSRARFLAAARMTTILSALTAGVISVAFMTSGPWVIALLSVDASVRLLARTYLPWAALAPLAGVWCFQLDGIFIGATRTAEMRNAMLMSLAIFLIAWWCLARFGNQGLWASFYVHYLARTATLLYFIPGVVRALEARP